MVEGSTQFHGVTKRAVVGMLGRRQPSGCVAGARVLGHILSGKEAGLQGSRGREHSAQREES